MLYEVITSATDEMVSSVEGMGADLVTAMWTSPKRTYVTIDDLNELTEDEDIKAVASATGGSNATVKAGSEVDDVSVTGITANYAEIQDQEIGRGT